jgi:16S rRNA (cytosine1402-N4)-methyltransferase
MNAPFHIPVMLHEAVDLLDCKPGGVYVDGTLGGGGHAYEILERTSPDGILIGIDCDYDAIESSRKRLQSFGDRSILVNSNFAEMKSILEDVDIAKVDGILLDLGVSSHQFEEVTRGFSFSKKAPLDMRMDRSRKRTAADIVNISSEGELKDIIKKYGEEREAGRIARAIARQRKVSPLETTTELAELIASVKRVKWGTKIHPATKTFQALRIAVNEELQNLSESLYDAVDLLRKDGRLSVISFHSLEDRVVKDFFRLGEKDCICPPDFPVCRCNKIRTLKVLTRRPVTPGEDELKANPRARSAKLRAAMRI